MQDLTHKRQDMYPERQSLKGPERDAARSACGGGRRGEPAAGAKTLRPGLRTGNSEEGETSD